MKPAHLPSVCPSTCRRVVLDRIVCDAELLKIGLLLADDEGPTEEVDVRVGARLNIARVTATDPAHSFVALPKSKEKQNNPTQKAALNGTVIAGWLVRAQVQVTFDVIVPATGTSCVPAAPANSRCFQGTIRTLLRDPEEESA
jgi:hypothetical protein